MVVRVVIAEETREIHGEMITTTRVRQRNKNSHPLPPKRNINPTPSLNPRSHINQAHPLLSLKEHPISHRVRGIVMDRLSTLLHLLGVARTREKENIVDFNFRVKFEI
jgi:hypothetical protein